MHTSDLDNLTRTMARSFAFCGIGIARGTNTYFAIGTAPGIIADSKTMFRAASISKVVVGQSVAALVDEKVADWQTDVSDILGWRLRHPDFPNTAITLDMLTGHGAGLTDRSGYLVPHDVTLQAWCAERPIYATKPGTHFSYCNLGYIILAEVAERLAGQPLPVLTRPFLPDPAGFNWIDVPAAARANRLPTYRRDGNNFVAQIDEEITQGPQGQNPGIYSPQGGLRLSLSGMLTLAQRLEHANATALWTPSMGSGDYCDGLFESYGVGLQIFKNPDFYPRPLVGHFGNAYGFNGGVWFDQSNNLSFAYALNGLPVGQDDDALSAEEKEIFATVAAL